MKRREILKWITPVVMAVYLPAHAQTSPRGDEENDPPEDDDSDDTNPPGDDDDSSDDDNDCVPKLYRIKSDSSSSWESDPGVGAKDCVTTNAQKADGSDFATISGDDRKQTVTVTKPGCVIIEAGFKAGQGCFVDNDNTGTVTITNGGTVAIFETNDKDISHVELILECCIEDTK